MHLQTSVLNSYTEHFFKSWDVVWGRPQEKPPGLRPQVLMVKSLTNLFYELNGMKLDISSMIYFTNPKNT